MANASNYLRNALIDHTTGESPWVAPTDIYLALLKSAPAASDDTTTNASKEVETPAANGYDREIVPFGAESGGTATNSTAVTFGPATANWVEAGYFWLVDAATGGNILAYGSLSSPKTVENTGSLVFEIGEIDFKMA